MLTAKDEERLASWLPEIGKLLFEASWVTEGDELRAMGSGGLSINSTKRVWWCHALGVGGGPLQLVMHAKGCSYGAAIEWADAFLRAHTGTGSATGTMPGDEDADNEIRNATIAQGLLDRLVPPAGTAAEAYLRARSIWRDGLPTSVRYLPDARVGEGAIVTLLVARGRVVGAQLGYLTPDGTKTTVRPTRRRMMLEKAPGVFSLLPPADRIYDKSPAIIITEGVEDALAVFALQPPVQIFGLPGIYALAHLDVPRGATVTIFRDGDEPGSAADRALTIGVDHLILSGAVVKITNTPGGEDANSVLQSGGIGALKELLDTATLAELSAKGRATKATRQGSAMDPIEYAVTRKTLARDAGIGVGILDREVRRARGGSTRDEAEEPDTDTIELLDGPVALAPVLEGIVGQLKRFIVAPEPALAAVALWCAHAHLVQHPRIRLPRSPRLAIQARDAGAGKTTLLECISELVPRPRMRASVTASSVLRVTDALHPTYLIDEAENVLRDQYSDLLAVLNAGDRRRAAWVERTTQKADGEFKVERFNVFGAVAFACIDELPRTQQDRSIVIQMEPALYNEVPEYMADEPPPELLLLKRQLATWAHLLGTLPSPDMPSFLTGLRARQGNNWRWLLAIAEVAGSRWPDLSRNAARQAVEREAKPSQIQRLLTSVVEIFAAREEDSRIVAAEKDRIQTRELAEALVRDTGEEWDRINRGKPITVYWLRDNLRHLLKNPPRVSEWEKRASDGKRLRYRGYYRSQFDWAIEHYLSTPPYPSTGSTASVEPIGIVENDARENPAHPIECLGADSTSTPPRHATPSRGKSRASKSIKSNTSRDTQHPKHISGGGERDSGEAAPVELNWDARPAPEPRRLTRHERSILAHIITNPDKSVDSVAKHFGLPRAAIQALIDRREG